MAFTDFVQDGSNIIASIMDFVIFWKNWDQFSQYALLGAIAFAFIGYRFLKSSITKDNNHVNAISKKRTRRLHR